MTDPVDRIRKQLDARIEKLRPLVREFECLERAAAALAHAEQGAGGGLGAGPPAPAAAKQEGKSPTTRAKPVARQPPAERRAATSVGPPAPRDQRQAAGHL